MLVRLDGTLGRLSVNILARVNEMYNLCSMAMATVVIARRKRLVPLSAAMSCITIFIGSIVSLARRKPSTRAIYRNVLAY
jgi:hypothetical protein